MGTEPWFRNPDNYIRELVEAGECRIAWDRGILVKRHLDPIKHASLFFGQAFPWRALCIGSQGTVEYRNGDKLNKPTAVYPTWEYGEDASMLEEIVASPIGQVREICDDRTIPPDERPVFGQEHRVVISNIPAGHTGPGKRFLLYLRDLQQEYPDCIIHVHGLYSWRMAFGMGLRAADVSPRESAQKGRVNLPSGKEEKFEHVQRHPQWVTVLGFKPADLAIPRNRCIYNIRSAVWASANYELLYKFQVHGGQDKPVDHTSSDAESVSTRSETVSPFTGKTSKPQEGDQFFCNTCSLQDKCKYYREGAVCSVPGAEPRKLASFFKTRDSDTIIEGLSTLVAAGATRVEKGMREEEAFGEMNPEVTKGINQVFAQGVQLAKLVDPNLRSPKVAVQVNGGQAAVAVGGSNPKQLVAAAIRELESRGIPRDKITPEAIQGLLVGMAEPERAQRSLSAPPVKGEVVERD